MDKYNLLLGDFVNASFSVVFDIYTPRPHFIILPKEGENIDPEFSRITKEQTELLIETGRSALKCFGIDDGILSIHRGSWRTTRDKFHVHVCVDVENYLKIYENKKKFIPDWPSRKYVTKQWRRKKDHHSYAENVRGYPYRSYLEDEVSSIRTIRGRPKKTDVKHKILVEEVELADAGAKIVYHSKHPKIGFAGKRPQSIREFQNVLLAMERFAKEHDLVTEESKDENHGCHICLYLGSVDTTDWNFSGDDGEDVCGHIVTTGFRFYQLCPVNLREEWFHSFRQSNFKCLT